MTLGQVLFNYRKANNLTIPQLAEKAGLSQSYMYSLEGEYICPKHGKSVSINVLRGCATAMNMPAIDLLEQIED